MTRKCEVCDKEYPEESLSVTSLPGIPMSVARCVECFAADVVPIWIAVATTAEIGGMEHAADWWRECVLDTLEYLKLDYDDFLTLVSDAMERYAAIDELEPLS